MAMITCPNCGEQISDKAKSCVHCGVSLQPEEKMVCEECGAELEGGIEICPACGCPVFPLFQHLLHSPVCQSIRHGNLLCGSVYFLFPFFQVLFLHILTSIPSAVFPSAATPDVLSTAQYSHSLQESVQSPASYIHRRHAFPQSCGPPHPS